MISLAEIRTDDMIGEGIIGRSAAMRNVFDQIRMVAPTDSTVLICGETGTGKELIARAIHSAGRRSDRPFIKLNCAALPAGLVESELFGHEKGAFSGALQRREGRFELANGGTIFLDEIGELPLDVQAKLLRVLQEQEFERVGSSKTLKVDVRVVAATNRDLRKAVASGAFREDLFYRLQVFDIAIAPLRERADDILPLSEAILEELGRSFGQPPAALTCDARQALVRYDWPGNIRELRNALERATIRCEGSLIDASHLALQPAAKPRGGMVSDLRNLERDTIITVLQECLWNKAQAAKRLGLSRTQLYGRMGKYMIEQERPASAA